MSQLNNEQLKKGVLAFSSGNHGQGIALAGQLLGTKTKIVVPKDGSKMKLSAMQGYGAELHYYDRYTENREEITQRLIEESGMTFVPPYDDFAIIAGQGTCGLELLEEVGHLDHLITTIGGGGLISGCSIAVKTINPNIQVHGVVPHCRRNVVESFSQNRVIPIDSAELKKTIADGAQTPKVGVKTLEIMRKNVNSITTATNDEIVSIMKLYAERCKIVAEPTGCLGLVGIRHLVRSGTIKPGDRVGCIITGGNVDMARFTELITSPTVPESKTDSTETTRRSACREFLGLRKLLSRFGLI